MQQAVCVCVCVPPARHAEWGSRKQVKCEGEIWEFWANERTNKREKETNRQVGKSIRTLQYLAKIVYTLPNINQVEVENTIMSSSSSSNIM